MAYRDRLKAEQLAKEAAAKARGGPLTAKEKERERSRRESAVTRKRAEVYIRELEAVARRLPWLEARLAALEADLRCRADAHRREERSAHSQIGELAAVKAEPRVVEGTQGFMMNRMRELEIRLREGEGV